MIEQIPIPGLIASILLPWLLGSVWVYCLLSSPGRWNVSLVLGHGYLTGLFLTTLIIRLWGFSGAPLTFWGISGVLCLLTLLGAGTAKLCARQERSTPPEKPRLDGMQAILVGVLGLLIFSRFLLLAGEISLRPLFPWDAWMNWAPKAVIWYEYGKLLPFVSPEEWLRLPAGSGSYTLGTWNYPPTVPLIQLWSMLALHTSDHTLVYLPWLILLFSLSLALFGHLRLDGCSTLLASLAVYVLVSIPFVDVHTALAGYADIWQAAGLGLASYALYAWQKTKSWRYAALAVFLAILNTQLKVPGAIIGLVVCGLLLLAMLPLSYRVKATVLFAIAAVIATAILLGLKLNVPGVGRFVLAVDTIEIPGLGSVELSYLPTHAQFLEALFIMANWNILWYVFLAILLRAMATGKFLSPPSLDLASALVVLLFIFFVMNFTGRAAWAEDFTTINRALLFVIPTIVFYISRNIPALLPTSIASDDCGRHRAFYKRRQCKRSGQRVTQKAAHVQ